MKERIITIAMQIDEEAHNASVKTSVTENGEPKDKFNDVEMATTLHAIHLAYDGLSGQFIKHLSEEYEIQIKGN